jgi:hypothetical protein
MFRVAQFRSEWPHISQNGSFVMSRIARWFALIAAAVSLGAKPNQPAPPYEVYAIRYASIPFRVAGLTAGADTSRRLERPVGYGTVLSAPQEDIMIRAQHRLM